MWGYVWPERSPRSVVGLGYALLTDHGVILYRPSHRNDFEHVLRFIES